MPNEFGVCMVYGRCCVYDTTARARHESPVISAVIDVKSWISLLFINFH